MAEEDPTKETGSDSKLPRKFCNPGYLASLPGFIRILNIILGSVLIGLWIPGYENDYKKPNQIVSFRDYSKSYGAGYKSETLNQFALSSIILCLGISLVFLLGMTIIAQASVDWNRLNKVVHVLLSLLNGIGTVCAAVGIWNFEENCCRVDLEWNGLGFKYTPAVYDYGYPRNNMQCTCWLTKREASVENERRYSTSLWEPQYYPDKYMGEESTFVSFAAHHVHIHMTALMLMILNTVLYLLGIIFTKPRTT